MATVKIYTTSTCPWCKKTKEWMKEKKISFTEYNVAKDEKARKRMMEISGQMGVPVLEIGKEVIVGFDPKGIEKAVKTLKKK